MLVEFEALLEMDAAETEAEVHEARARKVAVGGDHAGGFWLGA